MINRDPASMMERGQAGEGAKDGLSNGPSVTVGHEVDEKGDSAVPREDSADADALTMAMTEPEEAKPDNAPDGTEVFAEWKEGPHRIIERRTDLGEEVCLRFDEYAHVIMTRYRSRSRSKVTYMARAQPSALTAHLVAATLRYTVLQRHSSVERCDTFHTRLNLVLKACLASTLMLAYLRNIQVCLRLVHRLPERGLCCLHLSRHTSYWIRPQSQILRVLAKMMRMDGYLIRVGQRMSYWEGDINNVQNHHVVDPTKEDVQTATVLPPTFTAAHVCHFIPQ